MAESQVPTETTPTSTARKLIVVLGASYSGLSIAHYLLKHVVPTLGNPADYQVVLVSPSRETVVRVASPRAMISDDLLDQNKLFVDTTTVLKQYPAEMVRFLHGTAVKLSHQTKTVAIQPHGATPGTEPELINYHALVIATGASTTSPLLGLKTDSDALRAAWAELRAALPSAKTIVIAGGGPAGIETAGELAHYLNGRAGGASNSNNKVTITVVNGTDKILPVLRPALAAKAEKMLSALGVVVRNNTRVTSVEPSTSGTAANTASKTVVTLSDGTTLGADIYIPATGFIYNTAFVNPGLLNAQGRVKVNPGTFRIYADGGSSNNENALLYAVGDVCSAHRPAIHCILPAVPVLGNNMKRDLLCAEGKTDAALLPADKIYVEEKRETQIVPIGPSGGVGAVFGWKLPSFAVKFIKGRDYFLSTTPKLWNGQQWSKP